MWYVRCINTLSFIHCVSPRIYIWYHVVNLIYSFSYQFFIIFIKFSVIKCFYFRFSFTILNKSKTCSLVAINSLCGSHWISIFFHFIQVNIWKKNWVNCFRDFPRLKCLKNPTFRPVLPVFFRLFKMLPTWRIVNLYWTWENKDVFFVVQTCSVTISEKKVKRKNTLCYSYKVLILNILITKGHHSCIFHSSFSNNTYEQQLWKGNGNFFSTRLCFGEE